MITDSRYADLPPGAGPDGGNLLGFLSAVGALVAFTNIYGDQRVNLHWEQSLGWRGRVLIGNERLNDGDIEKLHQYLTEKENLERFTLCNTNTKERYKTITKIDLNDATACLTQSVEIGKCKRGRFTDALAGWFCDQPADESASSSQLCALTGGSQQNFLETALDLSGFHHSEGNKKRITNKEHLNNTLVEIWQFRDPMPGCRWEAQEDRHYALRHRNPTKTHKGEDESQYDGSICTQRGANRLGIEALAAFPLMPGSYRAETPGFFYSQKRKSHFFTWPIWTSPFSLDSLRVLIAHPEMTTEKPSREKLRPLGVDGLFRCKRVTKGKGQVSFTIANPV